MKFYGRESQRRSLYKMIDRMGHQVSLIYGRKRIGKSELIKQVLHESTNANKPQSLITWTVWLC